MASEGSICGFTGNFSEEDFKTCLQYVPNSTGLKYNSLEKIDIPSDVSMNSHFTKIFVNGLKVLDDYTSELAAEYLKILKPSGDLYIASKSPEGLMSVLKLSGFTDIRCSALEQHSFIQCSKPDFEVGSSTKISLPSAKVSAWKMDLEDDVEFDDPDDLLTEEDLVKPDPASLKVCGTTGQRKACKTCVCGLKEELEAEEMEKKAAGIKDFKPSCGSCYLGDAFRCASCPYLGMPAFKPGEKVILDTNTLVDKI